MQTTTRPAGAIATVLNPDTLLERGRIRLKEAFPEADPEALTHGPLPQMRFTADHGKTCIVNGEGVGETTTAEGRIHITFGYGMQWISVALTTDDITQATTKQTIDLAEGIRTFGDRLNRNHSIWFNRYTSTN